MQAKDKPENTTANSFLEMHHYIVKNGKIVGMEVVKKK